jgi:NADPH-dependent 2,4-dienoyl-CoA reductase/sulfur reductase-like enzyme
MEAARIAAMRGHKVVLIERDSRMGGQVNLGPVIN